MSKDLEDALDVLRGTGRELREQEIRQVLAAYREAALNFIGKVDRGEARSKRSYAEFAHAVRLHDALDGTRYDEEENQ